MSVVRHLLPRSAWAPIAVLLGMTGGCGGEHPAPAAPSARRPTTPTSLVIVDLSGVRSDEVATHLPTFEALAKEGAFFTQATASAAWDAPSVAGVFSGLSPDQCTVRGRPADGTSPMIPPIETLAEMLSDAGYATAAFTAGGHVSRRAGLEQGFQIWDEAGDDHGQLSRATTWWMSLERDRPRLLFLHARAATPPADGASARTARLRELDAFLGRARALAGASRPKDGVWFLALSDHGDVLEPREGGIDAGDTGVLDAQVRVPVALVGEGVAPGRIDASVSLLDVVPTIRARLGLPPSPFVEGRALQPLMEGVAARGRPVIAQAWRRVRTADNPMKQHVVAVRDAKSKFVAAFDLDTGAWTEELYDLGADPVERAPVAKPSTADVAARGEEFARAVKTVRDALGAGKAIFDDPITGPYVVRGSSRPK